MFTKHEIKERVQALRATGQTIPPYNLACLIADSALFLQTDKAGRDYAFHTAEVSLHNTDSLVKQIIGKLHDVVEDSDWTLEDLRDVGFSARVIAGVDGVTHRDGEPYFDSIERCAHNPDSVDVKLKDLRHNLSASRNTWLPTEKDMERQRKYILSYQYLVAIKKEEIRPGTSFYSWMCRQPTEMRDFALLKKESAWYQKCIGDNPPGYIPCRMP